MKFSYTVCTVSWYKPLESNVKMLIVFAAAAAKSLQSCPTLCDPIDGSPPGSPIPGILQARVLEWGTIIVFIPIQFTLLSKYSREKSLHLCSRIHL